jgi:hypothetical protein
LLLLGVALSASAAAAQPTAGERCRTDFVLRFKGTLYFHYKLRVRRPRVGRLQGIGLERACEDRYEPGEPPPPWFPVRVFALDGISPGAALAPTRSQVVFYDPYACSPRLGEERFLRCLRRR